MDLAGKYAEEIPFHTLPKEIDETHRRGSARAGMMPDKALRDRPTGSRGGHPRPED
jgi:hypothetical protein